jgi:hypothetical protein
VVWRLGVSLCVCVCVCVCVLCVVCVIDVCRIRHLRIIDYLDGAGEFIGDGKVEEVLFLGRGVGRLEVVVPEQGGQQLLDVGPLAARRTLRRRRRAERRVQPSGVRLSR